MNTITTVLLKVFVREFYRHHASFFLIVIGLCFGFMRGEEHKALAQSFVTLPILLTIPLSLWILYTLKIIQFNRATISLPQNEFISNINLCEPWPRYWSLIQILGAQLMPAIAYASFLVVTAVKLNCMLSVAILVLSLLTIIMVSAILLFRDLKNPHAKIKITFLKKLSDRYFTKPYHYFFIEWIVRKDAMILFGAKLFGSLMIFSFTNLYQTDAYDWRLLGIGLIIAFSGNTALLFYLHRFENFHFQIMRNLPLSLSRRFLGSVFICCILCFPEYCILVRNFPAELHYRMLIPALIFSMSLLAIVYAALYAVPSGMKKFTRIVFAIAVIEILLILFSTPLWAIALLNLTSGTILFKRCFYKYEMIA